MLKSILVILIVLNVSLKAESVSALSAGNWFKKHGTFNGLFSSNSSKNKKRKQRKYHKKRKHQKKQVVVQNTPERKIQMSLSTLGFYNGKLNGDLNSYSTKTAIKAMCKSYGMINTTTLNESVKGDLIFLSDLFNFDKILISRRNTIKDRNKRIQVALTIHGYYSGKIDGSIGTSTKQCIVKYNKSINQDNTNIGFNYSEEYELLDSAKKINDINLKETLASLKKIQNNNNEIKHTYINIDQTVK